MGYDFLNKILEIWEKNHAVGYEKTNFLAITAAILDLENRYYFLNIILLTFNLWASKFTF